MAGAIDVRVVALLGLILDVRGRDRDAARLLFRRFVDLIVGGVVAPPVSARILVMAAVSDVLPWST
jgi:hypothetical protein